MPDHTYDMGDILHTPDSVHQLHRALYWVVVVTLLICNLLTHG